MWFIGVEVEEEMSAPPPKKNPGSAHALLLSLSPCSLSFGTFYRRDFCTSMTEMPK